MSKCCNGGFRASFASLIWLIFVVKHSAHEDFLIHYRFERLNKVVCLSRIPNQPLGIPHFGKQVISILLGIIYQGLCKSAD